MKVEVLCWVGLIVTARGFNDAMLVLETERLIVPAKPKKLARVILVALVEPESTVREFMVGTMLKSGGGLTLTVAWWETLLLSAIIVAL